mmetsp:Transcript_8925/g.21663  ORF Transcript_8925/g.21663 Transcript_8925/m.21663 type:complete len:523 (-) Transcript_8925:33-1601(-)
MRLQTLLHVILLLKNISQGVAFNGPAPRFRLGLSRRQTWHVPYHLPGITFRGMLKQGRSITFSANLCQNSSDENEKKQSTTTVASQAALIAGTTIGGGFLALPAATAPCGAAPAALGLIGVWIFLLGSALSLSNAIFMLKHDGGKEGGMPVQGKAVSLFSLVRECFGSIAGILSGVLFLLLIKVTLIAQLSKVGVMLEGALPILNRQLWTSLFSISIAAIICLVGNQRMIERINDILTTTMLGSFATLVAFAGGSGWSLDGLNRADYKSLLPSFCGPWAIPIFIQLLIYNEVVPLVASRLDDEGKVRQAILVGSSVPLLMCLIWSFVALGLVPYEPSMITGGLIYDPLTNLADTVMSKGGNIGKLFLASVNILAGSAICTTVIGSILASTQYFDDIIAMLVSYGGRSGRTRLETEGNSSGALTNESNIYRRAITHTLAIAPSAIIAIGGSSELYYKATSFAGEFPCTLLYGLVPPLCNLSLRRKYGKREKRETKQGWKDLIMQLVLAMTSITILLVGFVSKY